MKAEKEFKAEDGSAYRIIMKGDYIPLYKNEKRSYIT